ncbi:MAG: tetratricopeptide repeat protein [Thermodesulfobacteriota bacterium]
MNTAFQRLTSIPILFFAFFWYSTHPVHAGQAVSVDAGVQFEYAESLFAASDYFMAASEYKRFIHLFPEHARVEEAAYKVGQCYLLAGQYARALQSFKKLIRTYADGRYSDQAQFSMSEAYLSSNQAGAAINTLRNLAIVTDDVETKDEAYYQMCWIYIGMGQWEQARMVLDGISQERRNSYRIEALSRSLNKEPKMKRKSPGLAGTLAVIPGAGYLYCGRYQDALIALLVNGGLIWAAYESFSNDLYALGSVITFVEIGFYSGNIYGSVASAHKYNRKNERQWIDQLRKRLKVSLASRPENRGIEVSLRYTF